MFRLKIALFSVLLSGLVIIGIGFYSLSVMNKIGLERIDREILSLGEGHLAVGPPREYWQNFEKSLRLIYREDRPEKLVFQIKDPQNEILFKSPNWPVEITESAFPGFDHTMEARPRIPESGNNRQDMRPSPPREAYQICEGKAEGTLAEFVNRRGETVQGICEKENGIMVLRKTVPDRYIPAKTVDEPINRASSPPDQDPKNKPIPRIKKPYFATIETFSGTWRTGIMGSERITMMVAANMAGYYADADRYRKALLAIVPIALILLAVGGWLISQRALNPVTVITRTAERITARALDQRVPPVNSDRELTRLVEVINGMLDRLEKSFSQAVRFSADAAHELQTPLTILQGELDDAIQHSRVGSEEQQRANGLLEEVQRLKAIVQKLLILARADAGKLNLRLETMDLSCLVESAAEDASAMAPNLKIEKQIMPGIIVKADPDMMGQVVSNLISNAVKYNQENGFIKFHLSVCDNRALFTISNSSMPIPAEDRERIFDRFYRVDQSRSKATAGSGLGLSLAREIVHAHHGQLRLDPSVGNLVSFTLTLPCSSR